MQCLILDDALRNRTGHRPTAMTDVAGEPFIRHQLRLLHDGGVDDVVVCVPYGGDRIEDEVARHCPTGMTVRYARDGGRLLESGRVIRRAVTDGLTDEQFMVLYAGTYPLVDFAEVWDWFDKAHHLGLLTVWHNDDRVDSSNAAVRNGRVVVYRMASNLISHPSLDYIDDGFGILTANAVLDLVRADEPHDLASLYSTIAGRSQLQAYEVDQRFHEIGSPSGLAELERLLTPELQRWP
jgi:NDP-sugar pyrophosphorylase family protein